jgi:hypothetical protein
VRTKPKAFTPRKLLVAVAGVASVNYVLACERPQPPTSGNLMAPSEPIGAVPPTAGNLPAPDPTVYERLARPDAGGTDAGGTDAGAQKDAGSAKDAGAKPAPTAPRRPPTSGNLMAPRGGLPE